MVQGGNNVYLLMMTPETRDFSDEQLLIQLDFQNKKNEYKDNPKLDKQENYEKSVEYALKATAKEYKMLFFKGKSGEDLVKQNLDEDE